MCASPTQGVLCGVSTPSLCGDACFNEADYVCHDGLLSEAGTHSTFDHDDDDDDFEDEHDEDTHEDDDTAEHDDHHDERDDEHDSARDEATTTTTQPIAVTQRLRTEL